MNCFGALEGVVGFAPGVNVTWTPVVGVRVGPGESVTPTVESVVLDESDTLEEGRREETEDVEEIGTASLDAEIIALFLEMRALSCMFT